MEKPNIPTQTPAGVTSASAVATSSSMSSMALGLVAVVAIGGGALYFTGTFDGSSGSSDGITADVIKSIEDIDSVTMELTLDVLDSNDINAGGINISLNGNLSEKQSEMSFSFSVQDDFLGNISGSLSIITAADDLYLRLDGLNFAGQEISLADFGVADGAWLYASADSASALYLDGQGQGPLDNISDLEKIGKEYEKKILEILRNSNAIDSTLTKAGPEMDGESTTMIDFTLNKEGAVDLVVAIMPVYIELIGDIYGDDPLFDNLAEELDLDEKTLRAELATALELIEVSGNVLVGDDTSRPYETNLVLNFEDPSLGDSSTLRMGLKLSNFNADFDVEIPDNTVNLEDLLAPYLDALQF